MSMVMSGEQIRAARALTRIEQADLARLCGVSVETIKRLERIRGPVDANIRTIRSIDEAFGRLGVAFDSENGGEMGVWLAGAAEEVRPVRVALSYISEHREQPLHRLIYFSTAVAMTDTEMQLALYDIVRTAGTRNGALGVTGALLACDGRFVQALEGPKDAVLQVYGGVCTDHRHRALHVAESAPITSRRFGTFNMCAKLLRLDDPVFADQYSILGHFDPRLLSASTTLDLLGLVMQGGASDREALRA
jgi:transcriptional regulator with XRE-family HTH domain